MDTASESLQRGVFSRPTRLWRATYNLPGRALCTCTYGVGRIASFGLVSTHVKCTTAPLALHVLLSISVCSPPPAPACMCTLFAGEARCMHNMDQTEIRGQGHPCIAEEGGVPAPDDLSLTGNGSVRNCSRTFLIWLKRQVKALSCCCSYIFLKRCVKR